MRKYILNPFYWYAGVWCIVLIIYPLQWSQLYPDLQPDLLCFVASTILISLYLGYKIQNKCIYKKIQSPIKYYNFSIKSIYFLYFLLLIKIVERGNLPFLNSLMGKDSGYMDVGNPFLNVIFVNFNMFLSFFFSYCLFSSKNTKYTKLLLLSLLCPLLLMGRGFLLYHFIGVFINYVICKIKNAKKTIVFSTFICAIILYLFGVLGNLRFAGNLFEFTSPSDDFMNSSIPKEYYWAYLYIATPIGNLQNAINLGYTYHSSDVNVLIFDQILPRFVSQYIGLRLPDYNGYLVIPALNVGTMYFRPFIAYGWLGMFSIFLVMSFVAFYLLKYIPNDSILRIPLCCILTVIFVFSMFDNMIHNMAFQIQLISIFMLCKKNF